MPANTLTNPELSNKDQRKAQLIEATIKTISKHGISNTTIAKVTRQANLSAGIVNFYFDSKQQLLLGTLRTLSEEYHQILGDAFQRPPTALEKVVSVIDAYFDEQLCDIDKIAVWWAFCSESGARNEYVAICGEQDSWFRNQLESTISMLCEEHSVDCKHAAAISRGLEGILDGIWQDFLFDAQNFNVNQCRELCISYLDAFFPIQANKSPSNIVDLPASRNELSDCLPVWTYQDDEFLELEKQALFRKNWLLVGHTSEIPAPRDYLTLDAVDERAIVIRGNDGVIRAFHNVCRHRGAKLLDRKSGQCGHALTCPFHGWTYRLEGDLIGVPAESTFANFNKAENRLISLDMEIWQGFVFVRFISGGDSVNASMQSVEHLFEPYQIENMVPICGSKFHQLRPYNWKVIHDIDNEGYHVPVGHPALQQLYGKSYTDTKIANNTLSYGYINEKPGNFWSVKHYQNLLPEYDHLPKENQRLWQYSSTFPSMVYGLYPDSIEFYMTIPVSIDQTIYRGCSYALADDRREAIAAQYLNRRINFETEREDESFVRAMQDGMKSSVFPEPNLSSIEQGVQDFHHQIQSLLPVASLKHHPGTGKIADTNNELIASRA